MFKLSDDYLIGFVEGEGMFYVGIVPSKQVKCGWQVIYMFKVSQNPNGKVILDYFKKKLRCGYVKPNDKSDSKDKSLAFVVRNIDDLRNKVLPFFRNRLVVKKRDFMAFEKVLDIVFLGKHTQKEGLKQIIDLAYSMNTGKRRLTKEYILNNFLD
jgi:hypothetical protein